MEKTFAVRTRRRPAPVWIKYLSTAVVGVLFWPWIRLFPRAAARRISRGMTRVFRTFEPYEPTAHDVLVCSYFKSGTNWTLQIAAQIAHRGRAEFEHIHDVVPWPDVPPRFRIAVPLADDRPRRAAPTGLRVIKTHLARGAVPFADAARYLCVVRDPKDVFVSSYHFTRSHVGFLMPPVSAWLDAYLSPDTALGSWAEHLESYWSVRHRSNVLFLTYESMRADLPGSVDKIAAFLGVDLTADEKAAVVDRSTFAYMKSIERKFDTIGAPWASTAGAMLRRGERGRSGELIDPDAQRRIDEYWRAELERLGSDFPYDAAFFAAPSVPAPAEAVGAHP